MTNRTISLDTLENLKRAAPSLQAILDLVVAFEKIGSIEQAIDESNARLAAARGAEGEFKASIEAQRREIEEYRRIAADVTAQAKRDATSCVEAAIAEVAHLKALAAEQAARHGQVLADLKENIEFETGNLAHVTELLKAAQIERAEFIAGTEAKKAELRALAGG